MKVSLAGNGLLEPGALRAFSKERARRVREGVAAGMREGGEKIVPELRSQLRAALGSPGLEKTVRVRVFERDDRLPVMYLGSSVGWLGVHEHGGTIKGPLLVPLIKPRPNAQRFRQLVSSLLARKAAFFKQVNGKVILFAREHRQVRPIAVLVQSVTLKKRLGFEQTVMRRLKVIAGAIERGIERSAKRGS
jgi:hypothetical protein